MGGEMIERVAGAFGNYSDGVSVNGPGRSVYIAGQIAVDNSGNLAPGGVEQETRAIFDRLDAVCRSLGSHLDDIVKLTVYMTDLSDYPEFAAVRAERLASDPPASSAVQVAGLLYGAHIEIDAVAFVPAT